MKLGVFLPGFTPVATILADAREDLTAFAASGCPLAQSYGVPTRWSG